MMPISASLTGTRPTSNDTFQPQQASRPPSSPHHRAFKLRPRSNSHPTDTAGDGPDLAGLGAPSTTDLKPIQHGIATVSPDGPIYPSASASGEGGLLASPRKPPPPAFASFFAKPSTNKCSSPTKKQKTERASPDASPSVKPESSPAQDVVALKSPPVISASENAPAFPLCLEVPSTPPAKKDVLETASSSSSTGKRPLSPDAGDESCKSLKSEEPSSMPPITQEEPSSPFTPRGRAMLQNLCISSPSQSLSSMSPTPGNSSISRHEVINQQLPSMPTFSFSPSLKLEKDCIFPSPHKESAGRSTAHTVDSSVRETIVFSAGSTATPLGTPNRAPRGSATSSTNSSPFHSLRGLHPGSSFKALPPRLYPNVREDSASSCASVASLTCPSPGSSKVSASSPRMVPLTVLSRNGSPVASPMKTTPPLPPFEFSEQSPLMRSLDRLDKEDSMADLLSPALSQPHLEEKVPGKGMEQSPMSGDSGLRLLPRIKLTPRGKRNFPPSKADESPGASSDLSMPALSGTSGLAAMPSPARERGLNLPSPARERYGLNVQPVSSFLTNSPGDREAAEMDSLLSGFEHHRTSSCGKEGRKEGPLREATLGDLSRVESEEAEIVSLTQGPFHGPFWPHPLPATRPEPSDCRRSSLLCSDEEGSCASHRPMPSITLDMSERSEAPCSASPSFLPRPVPVVPRRCRSLFSPTRKEEDPLEGIIRADAIAEAAKSNEPLTDDDSVEGEEADFLLCLPSTSHENGDCHGGAERKPPFKSDPFGFSESPSFNRCVESPLLTMSRSSSLSRRRRCSDQSLRGLSSPTTPTILEEGAVAPSEGGRPGPNAVFGSDHFHRLGPLEGMVKRETSDATFTTFCSLSDGDASEMMASPKYARAKALGGTKERQSTASLLSTSSLCGLDIVHEASMSSADEALDRVPVLLPSGSSEFSAPMFKSLRSELSMNSLGLSVDSASEDAGRDLYTPVMLSGRPMLSPPPLRCRAASPLPFDATRWK